MKFTAKNILTEFPNAGIADSTLKKQFADVKEIHEFYNDDAEIKKAIDTFVAKLNASHSPQKVATKAKTKAKATPVKKVAKTKAAPKVDNTERVEKILPEVVFIRRFAALDGKMVKTHREVALRILNSLQKAIEEKVIRKTSPYAELIMKVQDNLIRIIECKDGDTVISLNDIYKTTGKSQKISSFTSIAKSYISLQGKTGVKEKAKNLLVKVNTIIDEPIKYKIGKKIGELKEIQISLQRYVNGETDTPTIESRALQGLLGLAGVDFAPKSGAIVSSTDFLGSQFDILPVTGKWKLLIGQPEEKFRLMIFGSPGSGKSTLALQFAGYLSKNLNKKVLYIGGEEKFGYTLQDKIIRCNVANANLAVTDKIPSNLSQFDIVFIDSVNTFGLEPEDLRKLPNSCAYVFVFQTTKDGVFRGSQEFEHDVDTVIKVENMKATTGKNRFGGARQLVDVL